MKTSYKINFTVDGQARYQTAKNLESAISMARELHAAQGYTNVSITQSGKLIEWDGEVFAFDSKDIYTYKLKAKPLKQVSWKDMPVGVAVQTVNKKLVCTFVGMAANGLISIYNKTAGADDYRAARFELAPASEQPWIVRHGTNPKDIYALKGIDVTCKYVNSDLFLFKVTGIAEGWVLK